MSMEYTQPYVFISYAHKDRHLVLPLIRGLEARGIRLWYDEGLEVGTEWPEYIARHLKESSSMIAFITRNYDASGNCRREFSFSIDNGQDPLVVYLESVEQLSLGMQLQLASLHAMYYDRFPNADAFLDKLSEAALLKPCMQEQLEPKEKAVPVNAEEIVQFRNKAWNCYEQNNYEEAAKWYYKAAVQGDMISQNNLGTFYTNGQGVQKNLEEAVIWYRKAAEQGLARAQCNLGKCYERGQGVQKDLEEAVTWYRKAAEQGLARAQCNLGECYEYGQGVQKDLEEAVTWYRKAAEQGFGDALLKLSRCYKEGKGVKKSRKEAAKLYNEFINQFVNKYEKRQNQKTL